MQIVFFFWPVGPHQPNYVVLFSPPLVVFVAPTTIGYRAGVVLEQKDVTLEYVASRTLKSTPQFLPCLLILILKGKWVAKNEKKSNQHIKIVSLPLLLI